MNENSSQKVPAKIPVLLGRYLNDIASGMLGGAFVGVIAPTLLHLAKRLYWTFLWGPSQSLEDIAVWPAHWRITVGIVFIMSCALYGAVSYKALKRVWRSWRAGLLSGAFISWLLVSASAFSAVSLTGHVVFLALLVIPSAITIAILRRDAQFASTQPEDAEVNKDRSITRPDEDILNRGPVVASLLRAVTNDRSPVIALTGTYGDGKTSVLNLLTRVLEKRGDVMVVPFTAWLPMDEETLVATLFNSIVEKLETILFVPDVKRSFSRFTRVLFAVLPGVPASVKDLFENPSQSMQIAELRHSLARVPVRVVVLLDDMDRMHKNELGTLFKLLRGIPEFPQLTYVCAFDHDALTRTLQLGSSQESRHNAQQYLEKFFPDRIPLPRIEDSILLGEFSDRFIRICDRNSLLLDETERQTFLVEWRTTWRTLIRQYITNLRRLNLLTNRLSRVLQIIGDEINLKDILLLEIVRMRDPVMYEEIFQNPSYFMIARWRNIPATQLVHPDKDEARKRSDLYFETLFKALPPPPEGTLVGLLAQIFPSVMSYLRKKEVSTDSISAEKDRRIFHPDFFFRYFILQVPHDIFGEKQLATFANSINRSASVFDAARAYESQYVALKDSPPIRLDFLHRVNISIKRFNPISLKGILASISRLSTELAVDPNQMLENIQTRAIVFSAARELPESIETTLSAAIKDAESDRFATELLNDITSGSGNLSPQVTSVDRTQLFQAFSERMQAKYGSGGQSKFNESEVDIVPLGRWSHCGPDGREQVRGYLRKEFGHNPRNIGKFLKNFFPVPDYRPGLDPLTAIEIYFSVKELRQLVEVSGPASYATKDEANAVRLFKEAVSTPRDTNL
jgi:hypothetical protein